MDIILELQQTEQKLRRENDSLRRQLESKELKQSEAGSIAEAALSLNGVFEAAQAAADQYLAQIRAANSSVEAQAQQIRSAAEEQAQKTVSEAEAQAQQTISDAQKQADQIAAESQRKLAETDSEIAQRWEAFQARAEALLSARTELKSLLER